MGLSQVSASVLGFENDQFRKFKTIGLVNTSAADKLVTDSAAGATAYATGYKTNNGMISVDPSGNILKNIFEIAKTKNKSTGLVVTCSITNATPAAFLTHNKTRKEEFGIAEQISKVNVDFLAGAGLDFFAPKSAGGKREDNKNYLDSMKTRGFAIVSDTSKIGELSNYEKVYGVFGNLMLPHANQRKYTLGDLTHQAITSLKKNKNGFVLMVEGSQIDWAADQNDKTYLFAELKDFNSAIETCLQFAEKDQSTLVIVTADHDTGSLGISGKNKDTGLLDVVWATTKHTANSVGIFTYGPSSSIFGGIQENSDVGQKLIKLIDPPRK